MVANANHQISDEEREVFEKFFAGDALTEDIDLDALGRYLDGYIQQTKEVATTQLAMQVLRDLCLVSRAEGLTGEPERAVVDRIADGLGIPRAFLCQSVDAGLESDRKRRVDRATLTRRLSTPGNRLRPRASPCGGSGAR